VWGSDKSSLARIASIRVADPTLQHEVLGAYSRLVLISADGKRLHEELVPAGGVLRDGWFNRLGVGDLAKSLDAALGPDARPAAASDRARHALVSSWPKVSSNLSAAIDARAKERQESVPRLLDELPTPAGARFLVPPGRRTRA